jgi:hypothetical protein
MERDGPVDLKHTLTFFGLLSDLVGAVLLSIPMIWNTRAAAHAILKMMKRVKFWLYGYTNPGTTNRTQIFSRDAQEVHWRIVSVGAVVALCFGVIGFRLIELYAFRTSSSLLGAKPFWVLFGMSAAVIFAVLALYFVGKLPLYIARALIWIARGNHERRIGFVGLGILCIGFVLQTAVNLM